MQVDRFRQTGIAAEAEQGAVKCPVLTMDAGRVSAACGGAIPEGPSSASGACYLPMAIGSLPMESLPCPADAPGPVLVALPFKEEPDLITPANGTAFGRACGIWAGSFKRAWRIGRALEAGSVRINAHRQSVTTTPFGGFKNSGIGHEKGISGPCLYAQVKSMDSGLHEQPMSVAR
ncbi:aldehyde dehydrogenase family protein [Roseomonas sp. E05]|uniref:aldehyde dehydrogenase family protein n=1 Tax=Roseomonas sp. E05 TaxID=3046310 RepID=UPI0038D05A65